MGLKRLVPGGERSFTSPSLKNCTRSFQILQTLPVSGTSWTADRSGIRRFYPAEYPTFTGIITETPARGVTIQTSKMAEISNAIIRESWRRTLGGIATVPGRLAYLASLRDQNTGAYIHFGLSQKVGESEADRVLRQSHAEVFHRWLCMGIEPQKAEIRDYFSSLGGDPREIIANWLRLEPYRHWLPAESREAERSLFNADLANVSELIRLEFDVASPDRDL